MGKKRCRLYSTLPASLREWAINGPIDSSWLTSFYSLIAVFLLFFSFHDSLLQSLYDRVYFI